MPQVRTGVNHFFQLFFQFFQSVVRRRKRAIIDGNRLAGPGADHPFRLGSGVAETVESRQVELYAMGQRAAAPGDSAFLQSWRRFARMRAAKGKRP